MAGIHEIIRVPFNEPAAYAGVDEVFAGRYQSGFAHRKRAQVVIAVIDEGTHTDNGYLDSHRVGREDFTGTKFNENSISHGTRVAGVAVYGHPRIKYIDLRVRTQAGAGSLGARKAEEELPNIQKAMEAALKMGADIVVSALATENKKALYQATGVDRLIAATPGVLFVYGAGNNGRNVDAFDVCPAALGPLENMIIVGGCDGRHNTSTVSDGNGMAIHFGYGANSVDIASYGDNLSLYDPGYRHVFKKESGMDMDLLATDCGVSFAIPQVANVAAKMMLLHKHLLPRQIKAIIVEEASPQAVLAQKNRARGVLNPAACYGAVM